MDSAKLFFLAILAGFALIILPGLVEAGPVAGFVASLEPILVTLGLIVVLVFALVLIYHAIKKLSN
ncbi:hypothetical protein [Peribacillus sp. SCS-155]|uniref:hypothetical protein n=1 Tax=Peribacillus sedimenti TaxID=3115297 RepID=UPI003905FF3C